MGNHNGLTDKEFQRFEQMMAYAGGGGKLSHQNAVELLRMIERIVKPNPMQSLVLDAFDDLDRNDRRDRVDRKADVERAARHRL